MRNVRIWFTKLGRLQYISHLDMNRLMTRIVRRAEIPIWYTEGFNPHPYITFLLPLSLFVQSECEIMDIKVTEDIADETIKEKLNSVMPEGMQICKVAEPWAKATEVAYSQYTVLISPIGDCEECFLKISECMAGDRLIVTKKQKQGKKKVDTEVNLIDEIHSFYVSKTDDGRVNIDIILPSGTTKSVNPRIFTDAVISNINLEVKNVKITRKRILNERLEDFE